MTFGSGMGEAIVVGFESSFKTMPTPTCNGFKIPAIAPRETPSVGRFTSEALTGLAQPRPPAFGKQGLDWTLDLECNKDSLGPMFKGHFGAALADYGQAGWYDHYHGFTTMPSMFLEEQHSDLNPVENFLYQGKYAGSMDVTLDAEGLMRATFGGMGAFMALKRAVTAINGTLSDYTAALPLNLVNGVVKLNGTVVAYFQQIAIRSNRNVDKRNHIDGTTQVGVIFSQIPAVEITINASFQDIDLLEKAMNNTECSLEWYCFESGTGHGVKFICPTFIMRPSSVTTAGTGLLNVNVTGDAYGRGSYSNVAGESLGGYIGDGVLTGLNTKTLVVKPDALTDETFTFTSTEENGGLPTVVTKINATAVGLTASAEGGRLVLTSLTKGTTSKIKVQAGGTGNTILKVHTNECSGFNTQSLMARLSNANTTV